jgi:hypothetical protein
VVDSQSKASRIQGINQLATSHVGLEQTPVIICMFMLIGIEIARSVKPKESKNNR